jgi:hydroxymethylglutaryl-CoA lyase
MVEMKLIECPRDAMQGIHPFIPTGTKVEYLNTLLRVGFDTIDIGSFVNPKAIPQLADTAEVLHRLDLDGVKSKLLVIVANERGAEEAVQHDMVHYLGYPFSISETFQRRNTNTDIEGSWARTAHIAETARKAGKELVVYLSMGFGNPYGDPWSPEIALHWTDRLVNELGVRIIALSDTVGVARPEDISAMFHALLGEWGAAPRPTSRGGVRRPPPRPLGQLAHQDRRRLERRLPPLRWRTERLRRLPHGRG